MTKWREQHLSQTTNRNDSYAFCIMHTIHDVILQSSSQKRLAINLKRKKRTSIGLFILYSVDLEIETVDLIDRSNRTCKIYRTRKSACRPRLSLCKIWTYRWSIITVPYAKWTKYDHNNPSMFKLLTYENIWKKKLLNWKCLIPHHNMYYSLALLCIVLYFISYTNVRNAFVLTSK